MIVRVSSKMSLIAAQISSFETRTISSTVACTIGNVICADLAHRDAVGEDADAIEHDACGPPPATGYIASASNGSTPIIAHSRPERLDVAGDAGNQPAAADRDEDRRHIAEAVTQDFVADRALAGDDERVVERMHERQPGRLRRCRRSGPARRRSCRRASTTSAPISRTASTLISGVVCGMTMRARRPRCRAANATPLRVIAGAGRDDAARALRRRSDARCGCTRRAA